MKAGCDGFVAKPVQRQQLYEVLAKHLNGEEEEVKPVYSCLLEDEPDMIDIVSRFVSDMPNYCQDLHRCHEMNDWNGLARVAHQLKGLGGGYGYPRITDLAIAIEDAANAYNERETSRLVDEMCNYSKRIQAGIKNSS